ncbi:hypothetical protein [Paracoccus caeni]|nr:hypothetical protein [Paracoccus caeni]
MSGVNAEAKARVEALLLEPLAGLKRKRGRGAEDHDKAMERLRCDLAYMTDDELRGMVELITAHAVSTKGVWPDEGLIRVWAFDLRKPPAREATYPPSLMRSEMGDRAVAEGWAIELYAVAKRYGPPPPPRYMQGKLKEEAANNAHRVRVIEQNRAAGRATDDELAWLRRRDADMAEIHAIRAEKRESAA